ncbi:MAG: DUF3127 domain-containing protein [Bacteroidales bacterium]|jgi:hypothetical protein|nr:DUF3127 domain-containing protein [Bacteroidales bacterium]
MEFTAKLLQIREAQTGEGKNGPWKRQEYIFETDGQYPKKICVTVWGDRAIQDPSIMEIGNLLDVHFDLESREHNDRWYSDIKAWKIVRHGENGAAYGQQAYSGQPAYAAPAQASYPPPTPVMPAPNLSSPAAVTSAPESVVDDLPF